MLSHAPTSAEISDILENMGYPGITMWPYPKPSPVYLWMRALLEAAAEAGTREDVLGMLVACDSVLQQGTEADRDLVESLVERCNRRLAQLAAIGQS